MNMPVALTKRSYMVVDIITFIGSTELSHDVTTIMFVPQDQWMIWTWIFLLHAIMLPHEIYCSGIPWHISGDIYCFISVCSSTDSILLVSAIFMNHGSADDWFIFFGFPDSLRVRLCKKDLFIHQDLPKNSVAVTKRLSTVNYFTDSCDKCDKTPDGLRCE